MEYCLITREGIFAKELYTRILDIKDPAEQECEIQKLFDRAKELGLLQRVKDALAGYRKILKEALAAEKSRIVSSTGEEETVTNFTFNGSFLERHPYAESCQRLHCGEWVADDTGVSKVDDQGGEIIACRAPVTIIRKLLNMQTRTFKTEIAWARKGNWQSMIVPQAVVASNSKIVELADYGLPVTTENARPMIKYLSELDTANEDTVPTHLSSSKMGWHGKMQAFLPYDSEVVFDGDKQFAALSSSITSHGDYDTWLNHVKMLRRIGKPEVKVMLAASFASVLIDAIGMLPFIVSLWGSTEGGKSVTLMLATSVWANPQENCYIGDFKSTETALETRADLLNHLPMILDDTSKVSKRISDNFEGFVYDLTSGKGKSRATKDLGTRRENTWKNAILVTGEHPLSSYVSQGGAVNRIIEIEASKYIYENPRETAETVIGNYGYAGPDFIRAVKDIGQERLKRIYMDYYERLLTEETMQKQSSAMAAILTADKIATEQIFKDNEYIKLADAKKLLTNRGEVSEGQRAYLYILDKVEMNDRRFNDDLNVEQWGILRVIEDEPCICFFPQALDQLCKDGNYSRKALESWLLARNLILVGKGGKTANVMKIDGSAKRVIIIKRKELVPDKDGFMDAEQLEGPLPFDA